MMTLMMMMMMKMYQHRMTRNENSKRLTMLKISLRYIFIYDFCTRHAAWCTFVLSYHTTNQKYNSGLKKKFTASFTAASRPNKSARGVIHFPV